MKNNQLPEFPGENIKYDSVEEYYADKRPEGPPWEALSKWQKAKWKARRSFKRAKRSYNTVARLARLLGIK